MRSTFYLPAEVGRQFNQGSAMQPYQQRVIEEQAALDMKIGALVLFIHSPLFQDLARTEQNRLHVQLAFMQGYNTVLLQRIEAFHQ